MQKIALMLSFILFLTVGCGQKSGVEVPADGIIRLSDQFSGEFDLIDQDGAPFTSEALKGNAAVVYFGFATCPDVCPMALGTLSAALNELEPEELAKLKAVFITVDPERDTPEVMKAYLSSFHEDIVGLTGSVEVVDEARQSFKVYTKQQPLPDSEADYTMDHTSLFYLVDRHGQPKIALRDTLNAQQLAEMLRRNI